MCGRTGETATRVAAETPTNSHVQATGVMLLKLMGEHGLMMLEAWKKTVVPQHLPVLLKSSLLHPSAYCSPPAPPHPVRARCMQPSRLTRCTPTPSPHTVRPLLRNAPAPHPVRPLHEVNELEVLHSHVGVGQAELGAGLVLCKLCQPLLLGDRRPLACRMRVLSKRVLKKVGMKSRKQV